MSAADTLKLAKEKKKATDEGMKATNLAEAMTPSTKQELEASESGQETLSLHNKQVIGPSKDALRSESKALSSFLALLVGIASSDHPKPRS